ncbi:triose-phosphate isomerase [Burkholderiaceae bacterium FT117]|uniref:triose-phosphate isomerase n=1 Tax=Zeimonas sediminis TaxID=2944268 RepID=UPI00234319D4|nr:triose-phosphate isomerase [Zeimonas sediminis]MCM5572054.1 triose-phosphate isomerase [Zeimonas sediminis]
MKSRKPLVAGNWKMNGDIVTNEHLFTALRSALERASISQVDVVICPPFPYLGQAGAWLGDTGIAWGAQNVAAAANGALTGEVSVSMLADLGCGWAIVGHSERRTLLGETDEVVARKASMCVAGGLGVIACVGETLDEREADATEAVLARQVEALVPALQGADPARAVVAYEPVWAIGTGRTASPEMAQQAHAFIRARMAHAGVAGADAIRIVYGGSVKAANAMSLFSMPDVDGGLIGGASLVADEFLNICRAAAVA